MEEKGLDIRPSIAVTKAHIKLSELDETARKGDIPIDGRIVLKSRPLHNPDGTESEADPGVELVTSKAAVEPVWYLPGVAERFGMLVFHLMKLTICIYSCLFLVRSRSFVGHYSRIPEECTLN